MIQKQHNTITIKQMQTMIQLDQKIKASEGYTEEVYVVYWQVDYSRESELIKK